MPPPPLLCCCCCRCRCTYTCPLASPLFLCASPALDMQVESYPASWALPGALSASLGRNHEKQSLYSIHACSTSVGLYLRGGAGSRLFDLVCPPFMPIHPYLRSLSLMCSQFMLVLPLFVCLFVFGGWCSLDLVRPRVPSVCARSPSFALVQPHAVNSRLFDLWSGHLM
jgi:hypothetical protein